MGSSASVERACFNLIKTTESNSHALKSNENKKQRMVYRQCTRDILATVFLDSLEPKDIYLIHARQFMEDNTVFHATTMFNHFGLSSYSVEEGDKFDCSSKNQVNNCTFAVVFITRAYINAINSFDQNLSAELIYAVLKKTNVNIIVIFLEENLIHHFNGFIFTLLGTCTRVDVLPEYFSTFLDVSQINSTNNLMKKISFYVPTLMFEYVLQTGTKAWRNTKSPEVDDNNETDELFLLFENAVIGDYHSCQTLVFKAKHGNVKAHGILKFIYSNLFELKQGTTMTKFIHHTRDWLESHAIQTRGDPELQFMYGYCCYRGIGFKRNEHEAHLFFRMSAIQNFAYAQYYLGLYYTDHDSQTKIEPHILFLKAANQGYVLAQYRLGVLYDEGKQVRRNKNESVKMYRLAAHQGHAPAQNNYGACLAFGVGNEKDESAAFYWYRLAAEQQYVHAIFNVGMCFLSGSGTLKNINECLRCLHCAARLQHGEALYNLGVIYYNGTEKNKSIKRALVYFYLSTKLKNTKAMYYLGKCYLLNEVRNVDKALKCFNYLADRGDVLAKQELRHLYGLE